MGGSAELGTQGSLTSPHPDPTNLLGLAVPVSPELALGLVYLPAGHLREGMGGGPSA